MKTLIYIKKDKHRQELLSLAESNSNWQLHTESGDISGLKKLQKAANFAATADCELLVDVQEEVQLDQITFLLNSLEDQDIPTEVLVAESDQTPKGNESRALLMLQLLTGENICGFRNKFRLYPTKLLTNVPIHFYDDELFYTRILIQGARSGYKIRNIKLNDYSPKALLAVPGKRFFTWELLKALRPWPTKRLCERNFRKEKFKEFFFHPVKFLKFLVMENASPGGLAAAAATGMFLGTLPLLGFHTAAIIYVSIKLRLNKNAFSKYQPFMYAPFCSDCMY